MYNQPNYFYNMQPQMRYAQPMQQPIMQQPIEQQNFKSQNIGIQGKLVDSLDMVKAVDIPFDGSISYFPLTDGSAIVTKQLQMDGTSKTVIYKPTTNEDVKEVKYVTSDEMNELKEQLNKLQSQYRDLIKARKKE